FNNAVKYSGADNIQVRFKFSNKKLLQMQITDNGCGFKLDDRQPGNGLVNMQKRAAEIKGKLAVNTSPGKGTDIDIICKIA
ncbi:MAG: ATP-binding protein, partial [Mucilaginibacter sp.]